MAEKVFGNPLERHSLETLMNPEMAIYNAAKLLFEMGRREFTIRDESLFIQFQALPESAPPKPREAAPKPVIRKGEEERLMDALEDPEAFEEQQTGGMEIG